MDLANSIGIFHRCSNIDGQKPIILNLTNPQVFLFGVFSNQFITDAVILHGFMHLIHSFYITIKPIVKIIYKQFEAEIHLAEIHLAEIHLPYSPV